MEGMVFIPDVFSSHLGSAVHWLVQ